MSVNCLNRFFPACELTTITIAAVARTDCWQDDLLVQPVGGIQGTSQIFKSFRSLHLMRNLHCDVRHVLIEKVRLQCEQKLKSHGPLNRHGRSFYFMQNIILP